MMVIVWQLMATASTTGTVTVEAETVAIEAAASTGHVVFPETFSDHGADWCDRLAVLELVDSGRRETHASAVCWSCPEIGMLKKKIILI